MMTFGLGDRANPIREGKRPREIGKLEDALEPLNTFPLDHAPSRNVFPQLRDLCIRRGR